MYLYFTCYCNCTLDFEPNNIFKQQNQSNDLLQRDFVDICTRCPPIDYKIFVDLTPNNLLFHKRVYIFSQSSARVDLKARKMLIIFQFTKILYRSSALCYANSNSIGLYLLRSSFEFHKHKRNGGQLFKFQTIHSSSTYRDNPKKPVGQGTVSNVVSGVWDPDPLLGFFPVKIV